MKLLIKVYICILFVCHYIFQVIKVFIQGASYHNITDRIGGQKLVQQSLKGNYYVPILRNLNPVLGWKTPDFVACLNKLAISEYQAIFVCRAQEHNFIWFHKRENFRFLNLEFCLGLIQTRFGKADILAYLKQPNVRSGFIL